MSKDVEFEVLDSGSISGFEKRRNFVIYEKDDWNHLLDEIGIYLNKIPEIDFDNDMVIVLFSGIVNKGGHTITVLHISESDSELNIQFLERGPAPNEFAISIISTPYCIIKLKKNNKIPHYVNFI